jgi:heme exporter protein B
MSWLNPFIAIVARDLRLAIRQGGSTLLVIAFFVITVTLFPFGVGPETGVLERISAGVVWVAALLAALLSLDRMYQADYEDGSLEQLALSGAGLGTITMAKITAHWLTTGLPLLITAPILAVLMQMQADGFPALLLSMVLGTPILSLIGSIGAALTVGVRRGGVLLSLLVLPLYIPVLIFAVGAVDAAAQGLPVESHLMLLGAILLVALPLCPWASAAALRLFLD